MKRKIRQNVWGNWNGYVGTRKACEFGTRVDEAEQWLRDPDAFEAERNARAERLQAAFQPVRKEPAGVNTTDPRQWFFDVVNGAGDTCTVPLLIATDRANDRQRFNGTVIARARAVLPDVEPFKVTQSYQLP